MNTNSNTRKNKMDDGDQGNGVQNDGVLDNNGVQDNNGDQDNMNNNGDQDNNVIVNNVGVQNNGNQNDDVQNDSEAAPEAAAEDPNAAAAAAEHEDDAPEGQGAAELDDDAPEDDAPEGQAAAEPDDAPPTVARLLVEALRARNLPSDWFRNGSNVCKITDSRLRWMISRDYRDDSYVWSIHGLPHYIFIQLEGHFGDIGSNALYAHDQVNLEILVKLLHSICPELEIPSALPLLLPLD